MLSVHKDYGELVVLRLSRHLISSRPNKSIRFLYYKLSGLNYSSTTSLTKHLMFYRAYLPFSFARTQIIQHLLQRASPPL